MRWNFLTPFSASSQCLQIFAGESESDLISDAETAVPIDSNALHFFFL